MKNPNRRRLLKTLAASGGVVTTLPTLWRTPLVETALLPAHAVSSDCTVYAIHEQLIPDLEFNGSQDQMTVCAVICNGIGQVSQQPSDSQIPIYGAVRRDGTVPVGGGQGSMTVVPGGVGCDPGQQSVPATLTNENPGVSITFTLIRPKNGNLVIELPAVDRCPPFRPVNCNET